jgi:hypothetical protein
MRVFSSLTVSFSCPMISRILSTASGCIFRSLHQTYQPSPHWRTSRPVHRHFRGLLSVHSRYGLHTRWIIQNDPLNPRLQPLRYLHDCSDCFRLERNCRVGLSPTGKRRPCTAHANSCHSLKTNERQIYTLKSVILIQVAIDSHRPLPTIQYTFTQQPSSSTIT